MRRRSWNDGAWSGIEPAAGSPLLAEALTVYRGTPGNDKFTGTAGADKWFAGVGGDDQFDGLGGMDTVVIDFSAESAVPGSPDYHFVASDEKGYFRGGGKWSSGYATFTHTESVIMTGTIDDDQFRIEAEPLNLGGFLKLDGAGGSDLLHISFQGLTNDITFVAHTDGRIQSNIGTFQNFETFWVTGGSGDDLIGGGVGNDVLNGGTGDDTVTYAEATAGVHVDLAEETAQDTIGAGRDNVIAENLIGSAFADVLTGSDVKNTLEGGRGIDRLSGGDGSDLLVGDAGNDRLDGGRANDVLNGGKGGDTMTGGTGADVFRFITLGDVGSSAHLDRIADFSSTHDRPVAHRPRRERSRRPELHLRRHRCVLDRRRRLSASLRSGW